MPFKVDGESTGLSEPEIHTRVNAGIDLKNLKKALGFTRFDLQGQLLLDLTAEGKYSKKIIQRSFRKKDTVLVYTAFLLLI